MAILRAPNSASRSGTPADRTGNSKRLPRSLLQAKVEVIVAVNTPAVQAAKKATETVPVVMMRVADPVKSGLVASLARPGGNITGLSFMPDALGPKGVELLYENPPPGHADGCALSRGQCRGRSSSSTRSNARAGGSD